MEGKTFLVWDYQTEDAFIPKNANFIDYQCAKTQESYTGKKFPAALWELTQFLGNPVGYAEKNLLRRASRCSTHPNVVLYNIADVAYLYHVATNTKPVLDSELEIIRA